MKRFLLLTVLSVFAISLAACSKTDDAKSIAIVTSAAGQNDNGYNESAVDGAKKIKDEFGVDYHVVDTTDVPGALEQLAESGYELIFSLEYNFDALVNGVGGAKSIAEKYPDTTFVVFNDNPNLNEDGTVKHENVISVVFDVHESSYLAGALSVSVLENASTLFDASTYSFADLDVDGRSIGFIGGVQSNGITVFSYGFVEGINRAAADLNVNYDYYTDYSAGFGDPVSGSTISNTMYQNGVNVVYSVAGVVGDGVASKANELDRLAIQVDANKDADQPGSILTSVLKNTEVPVYQITKAFIDEKIGDLDNALSYDLDSGATGMTDLAEIEKMVTASGMTKWNEIKTYIETLATEIADGTVTVTDAQSGETLDTTTLTNVTVK
ncbi:BMP family ABC transporter substrate-binding protein [Candidatus Izimaplasma bacterium ZiA1]|uniref:BMP family lipoprotein n=1 Tax=Candidatus Izimoplasma sp. ZiA1 TaxID=2024899 RepID=UPI000BAA50D4|nr:BMP family ABC transporter substrate-binding protein [Candidatus Izimaplasma bacterium ZiA1]